MCSPLQVVVSLPKFLGVLILAYDVSLFYRFFAGLQAHVADEPPKDSRWMPWAEDGQGLSFSLDGSQVEAEIKKSGCYKLGNSFQMRLD
jgi:hypothetical protein